MLDAREIADRLLPVADHIGERAEDCGTSLRLPLLHSQLLELMNGFTLQQGTLRLFGVCRGDVLDLDWWNAKDTWRSVWDERVDHFVFFGATAWGDQYAYRRLPDGQLEEDVYFLEGTLLRAEPLSRSFAEFAETELTRVAQRPYDSMTIGALARFGSIDPQDQWALAPSIALGGDESLDNVVRLRARDAMTIAGDIAVGLHASVSGSGPSRLQPWVDEFGRQRLELQFRHP